MKKLLAFFLTLFALCNLSAQKPQPIQIQTINDSAYVVQYVPISAAQKNVDAQLTQVSKQLETVNKQIAEQIKKRDELMKQKTALEFAAAQLEQAAAAPPATKSAAKTPDPVITSPVPEKKPVKKKAKKTKSKN